MFGPTIQGEGSSIGTPVLFLRTSGCNRWSGRPEDKEKSICNFCDTDFFGGDMLTAEEIAEKLKELSKDVKVVVISGGEPTLQIDENLLSILSLNGFKLHLETNGSRAIGGLTKYFSHISMSPKQSREETHLEYADDIKLLFPFIKDSITYQAFKFFPHKQTYIQPLWDSNKKETLEFIFKNPLVKLSPQLHKYLELQ